MKKMEWERLFACSQLVLGDSTNPDTRRAFQRDIDRIVFSRSFRQMQDKTQVHPLSKSSHVRTRLTHSIEVASVGRSIGTAVGLEIAPRLENITADDFGYVVQAACLAHDIGNPPFGHGGEEAIRSWYKEEKEAGGNVVEGLTDAEYADLISFDGNAQGFRILTNIEMKPDRGGLQLTHAALGAFMKYPSSGDFPSDRRKDYIGAKKAGYFNAEAHYYEECAENLGLIEMPIDGVKSWYRHPLVYLMEAADDICYSIIDIEDGYETGYLNLEQVQDILDPISELKKPSDEISIYRAVAINRLIGAVVKVFLDNEDAILRGELNSDLLSLTKYAGAVNRAKKEAIIHVFRSDSVLWPETIGYEVIHGILDAFAPLIPALEACGWDSSGLRGKLFNYSLLIDQKLDGANSKYNAAMRLNDYISGLTDGAALALFRRLKGISL